MVMMVTMAMMVVMVIVYVHTRESSKGSSIFIII